MGSFCLRTEHPMKILVSGASGMVGSALTERCVAEGDRVIPLGRRPVSGGLVWDPSAGRIDLEALNGFDAVVHLAGETVAGRWTAEKKRAIRASRVDGTKLLCESLAQLSHPPAVLISASATGFYGDRAEMVCDETASVGQGFLAEVAAEWERATQPAIAAGIRVVHLRIGIVLSQKGGALREMLLPFRLGMGGRIGSGRQYWSWITLHDLVRVIRFCITETRLQGPVNAVSPESVTQADFAKALGRAIHRPSILPMPAFLAKAVLGEMAEGLLLASTRAMPRRLLATGFEFKEPRLDPALRGLLR